MRKEELAITLIKNLIKDANLDNKKYTNHSIRATVIGSLDDEGFEACHTTAISSHKNENTIKTSKSVQRNPIFR